MLEELLPVLLLSIVTARRWLLRRIDRNGYGWLRLFALACFAFTMDIPPVAEALTLGDSPTLAKLIKHVAILGLAWQSLYLTDQARGSARRQGPMARKPVAVIAVVLILSWVIGLLDGHPMPGASDRTGWLWWVATHAYIVVYLWCTAAAAIGVHDLRGRRVTVEVRLMAAAFLVGIASSVAYYSWKLALVGLQISERAPAWMVEANTPVRATLALGVVIGTLLASEAQTLARLRLVKAGLDGYRLHKLRPYREHLGAAAPHVTFPHRWSSPGDQLAMEVDEIEHGLLELSQWEPGKSPQHAEDLTHQLYVPGSRIMRRGIPREHVVLALRAEYARAAALAQDRPTEAVPAGTPPLHNPHADRATAKAATRLSADRGVQLAAKPTGLSLQDLLDLAEARTLLPRIAERDARSRWIESR